MTYRRTLGVLSWPCGHRPGTVIVVGQEHIEDTTVGRRHIHVLGEAESPFAEELYKNCRVLSREHCMSRWYSDCSNPMWKVFDGQNRQDRIHEIPPIRLIHSIVFHDGNSLDGYIQLILQRLQTGRKSLHFGKASVLPARLLEIQGDIGSARPDDYPAMVALISAIAELDLQEPARASDLMEAENFGSRV